MRGRDLASAHLDDRELTAIHDGELTGDVAVRVRAHFFSCRQCRNRAEQLESTLREFTEYCDDVTTRLGPPPEEWLGEPQRALPRRRRPPKLSARALASAAMVFCLIDGLFTDQMLPAARAMEVLRRARDSDSARIAGLTGPVLYERLAVSGAGKAAEWEIWKTVRGSEHASRWTGSPELRDELLRTYSVAGWDVDAPLSPAAFLSWLEHGEIDSVGVQRDRASLSIRARLRSQGSGMPVVETSMTLALDGLRPVERWIRIEAAGAASEFRLREVSYSAVQYAAAPFAPHSQHPLRLPPRSPVPLPVLQPSRDELELAEAEVRWKLHQMRADFELGPQIEHTQDRVVVRILADSAARRDAIRAALARQPYLNLEVWTADDSPPDTFRPEPAAASRPQRLYRSNAPLSDVLAHCLGAPAASLLVDSVHQHLRAAMVPALALEGLSVRYDAAAYGQLPAAARVRVDRIASDYLASLRGHSLALHRSLAEGLAACQALQPREAPPAGFLPATWIQAGPFYTQTLRTLDASFSYLFTTQETGSQPPTLNEAVARLARSSVVLQSLNSQNFMPDERASAGFETPASK
jgi:hypothetical protein